MNIMSRRLAMRAMAGAASAVALADKADMEKLIGDNNEGNRAGYPSATEKFTSFSDWMNKYGHKALKEQAWYIRAWDADILDMGLPLVTKTRMQRSRNYERAVEDRKRDFANSIGLSGVFEWWP